MRKLLRRPRKGLYVAISSLLILIGIVVTTNPGQITTEIIFLLALASLVWGICEWINLEKIWKFSMPVWIVGLLITNRFGALDLFTLGVAVGLFGLIILTRGRV